MDPVNQFYRVLSREEGCSLEDCLSEAWEMIPSFPGQPLGPGGYQPILNGFHIAFPDSKFEIVNRFDAENVVTVVTMATATHSGPFLGVEATGRSVTFRTIDVHEVKNNRITRSWHLEDFFGLFLQMTS